MEKPYFTLSKKIILEKYFEIEQISDLVSYSSKTNPLVSPILEQETKTYFSIHLENELKNVSDKKRVIYLAQGWNEKSIYRLMLEGIDKFAVDNEPDLEELLNFLKKNPLQKIEILFLRMKLKENTLKTEKFFVFGMKSETINQQIKKLKNHPQIKNLGIHTHRKTQNMAEWNLEYEYQQVLSEETMETINYLNIGGGLPSTYANTNEKVIDSIKEKIKQLKKYLNEKNIKLIIEPGRYIAAPAGKLHSKILRIYENNIIVNASVYNTDMDALIVPVKLLIEGEEKKGEGEPYVIKGITPCSMDLFRYRVYLKKPQEGDEIIFLNAGAYNFSSNFVDLEELETRIID